MQVRSAISACQDSNATDKYEQKQTTAVSDLIEDVQSIHKINKGSKALKKTRQLKLSRIFYKIEVKKLSSIALNNLGVSYLKQGLPGIGPSLLSLSPLQMAQSTRKIYWKFNLVSFIILANTKKLLNIIAKV